MGTTYHDVEDRAAQFGVEPIEVLQAERAALVDEAAPLRARRDVFDARRKEYRNRVAALIRAETPGRKYGAQEMEAVASGDARYRAFLDEAEEAFARLAVLDMKIQSITERINRGQALLRYAASEPKA